MDLLKINGNSQGRIVNHTGTGTLSMSGVHIYYGFHCPLNQHAEGGCFVSASTVVLADSVVSHCHVRADAADQAVGGGIAASRVVATGSTISDNVADTPAPAYSAGGGIYTSYYLSLNQTTVATTIADIGGGIILEKAGDNLVIMNSTISGTKRLPLAQAFGRIFKRDH